MKKSWFNFCNLIEHLRMWRNRERLPDMGDEKSSYMLSRTKLTSDPQWMTSIIIIYFKMDSWNKTQLSYTGLASALSNVCMKNTPKSKALEIMFRLNTKRHCIKIVWNMKFPWICLLCLLSKYVLYEQLVNLYIWLHRSGSEILFTNYLL